MDEWHINGKIPDNGRWYFHQMPLDLFAIELTLGIYTSVNSLHFKVHSNLRALSAKSATDSAKAIRTSTSISLGTVN